MKGLKGVAAQGATAATVPMPLVGHQSGFTCSQNSCQVPDHIHEAPPTDSWYFDHAGIFCYIILLGAVQLIKLQDGV